MNHWESKIIEQNTELAVDHRAVVVKIPTPHKVLYHHEESRFLGQWTRSTVDFIGTAGARGVAFEAKKTEGTSLPVYTASDYKGDGLKRHQRNFLAHYTRTGGLAFVYLLHEPTETAYVLPVDADGVVAGVRSSDRKSWPVDPDSIYRCRDLETWLDATERMGFL